jgi:branched-chain amino acid transport system substrate-binding protein
MARRKTLALLCVFAVLTAMIVVVAACGGGSSTTTSGPATTVGPATTSGASTTAASTATTAVSTGGAAKTLKIGSVMPLTGPLSVVSLAFTRGWEIYADEVNAAGGVKIGNDTYKIQFINEDSKGSAEGAGTAATKLVNQDKVQIIIGGILESEMAAIYQVTGPAGVLYAQANANIPGAPQDVSADKNLQVRPFINHDDTQPIDLDYLVQTYPNAKKIALSVPDIGYDSMVTSLKTEAAAKGLQVVAEEKWTWGTTDFTPVMTKLEASSPDVIWAMVSGQANDQLKAARQMGFKGVFVSNSPLGADVFVATVKDPTMLTDVICNSPDVTHPNDGMTKIMNAWKAKWPSDGFVSDSIHAYDMPWVLVQAMQKAGSTDPTAIQTAIESMTNPGDVKTIEGDGWFGGKARFGVNRVLYRPLPLTRIMNGVAEFIGFQVPKE